jgi:dolichol-phosphate mannosyltransferase
MSQARISLIVSVYNEEENLTLLWQSIEEVSLTISYNIEVVFVNDGSSDASISVLRSLSSAHITKQIVNFSRNFGHEAAMYAGFEHAKGDVHICMDADMQHPHHLIPNIIAEWENGAKIVLMERRKNEADSALKTFFTKKFYQILKRISEVNINPLVSDFFMVDEQVRRILCEKYKERNLFMRGLVQSVGFPTKVLPFEAPNRNAGESKYSFFSLILLSLDAVTSLSKKPLLIGLYLSVLLATFSVIMSIYSIVMYFLGNPLSGYTTIVVLITFLFAVLFFLMGLLGKYISIIFEEIKNRPIYLKEEE